MIRVAFLDGEVCIAEFQKITANIVSLKGQVPDNKSGFRVYSQTNRSLLGKYDEYKTIYRKDNEIVEFSNDGTVYVEPVIPVPPTPVIKFVSTGGGIIEGESEQEAEKWEDVVIPTPIPEEGYIFIGWNPEIPEEGQTESGVYTAQFRDCHVNFAAGEGGYLEGDMYQLVHDYSELNVPVPMPHEDYKFTVWEPEIPESGTIAMDNLSFTAVFQSNLPDRIKSLEGDMEALNKAMGGD